MLYVESDNDPANATYAAIGFSRHHTDRAYELGAMTSLDVIGRSHREHPCCGTTRIGTNSPPCSTASPVTDSTRCGPASTSGARRSTISPTSPRPSGPPHRRTPACAHPEVESISDDGDTVKWLWRLYDGHKIETVLMHYDDRTTVCVSSQAGCAMACGFCATGQSGFDRHLSVGEIVEQIVRARRQSAPRRVSNIVFMGMGEPFANYDRTWAAVERINKDLGIGARHITISTVGVVPGIERLAEEDLPVNLAVSLHVANDRDRDELVPLNKRYPLDRLHEACRRYLDAKNRRPPSSGPSSMVSTTGLRCRRTR